LEEGIGMKLSTKGRYGIRALIDITVYAGNEHVSLYSIAERQEISENYLEQVFSVLRKAGIVKSVKGAQGGYILADKPQNITAGKILRTLEGDLSIIEADSVSSSTENNSISNLIKVNVWDKMTDNLNQLVDSITLEDLAEDYMRMNGMLASMYFI
jgi:Rrf2 family protein